MICVERLRGLLRHGRNRSQPWCEHDPEEGCELPDPLDAELVAAFLDAAAGQVVVAVVTRTGRQIALRSRP